MSLSYNELKKGMALDIDGKPCILLEYSRSKKDRGAPVIRIRYKEIRTEKVLMKSYSGYDIKIEPANIQRFNATYLYSDQNNYVFMNNSSYEQINLSKEILGDRINYLVDQLQIDLLYFENNPISIELPNQITCKIESTDVALKGQTVSSSYKPAILDNGTKIQVPPFIESGDEIVVDTRSIEYVKKI